MEKFFNDTLNLEPPEALVNQGKQAVQGSRVQGSYLLEVFG